MDKCYKLLVNSLFIILTMLFTLPCKTEDSRLYVYGKGIAGDFDNPILELKYPEIVWEGNDVTGFDSARDMAFEIQTGNQEFDLFAIGYANGGFDFLAQKGFCLDLSESEALLNQVKRMHPYLQDAVFREGKLFGIPISVDASGWEYDVENCKSVGLDADKIPKTYDELFDLLEWWLDEGYDLNPEYAFFLDATQSRERLVNSIVYRYVEYCQQKQIPLRFDNELFYHVMRRLDQIDTDLLDEQISAHTDGLAYGDNALFKTQRNYLDFYMQHGKESKPMPLSFDDEQADISAEIRLFIINPQSTHIPEAIQYLLCFLDGLDAEEKIILFRDYEEPIENPNYEAEMKEAQAFLSAAQSRLALCDNDAQAAQIMEDIDMLKRGVEQIENNRWYVTKDNIRAYKDMVPYMFVREQNIMERNFTDGQLEIRDTITQYARREITLENFIKKANDVVFMIEAEDI